MQDEFVLTAANGLYVKPTNAEFAPFVVHGKVTVKTFPDGDVYYCAGRSFPAEIVEEILTADGSVYVA